VTIDRSNVVSSFTIIKGSRIEETYAAFRGWNLDSPKQANLQRLRDENSIGAASANWLRDLVFVISRRFDTDGRDRPLVELAQAGLDRETWDPLLLWHITRDEFLVRDFLVSWLFPHYIEGAYRLDGAEVEAYLGSLATRDGIEWSGAWTASTTSRVASGLLRIAADFGLIKGSVAKHFASYHLPEPSFLYVLHAIADTETSVNRIIASPDWRMYLLASDDVERQIVHLHQFRKLHYEVAGSLAQLTLPCRSAAEFASRMMAA
jgi:hypothetical protein